MKKTLILIGISLVMIGGVGSFLLGKAFFNQELVENEAQFDTSEIERIHVDLKVAKVNIVPTNDEKITLKWTLPQDIANSGGLHVQQKGELIQVLERERKFMTPILKIWRSPEVSLTIQVPVEHPLTELNLTTNVGTIYIDRQNVEDLFVETDVSNVQVKDTISNELVVRSSVGTIDVEGFTGEVKIRNEVGKVNLRSDRIVGDVDVQTEVGGIHLQLAEQQTNVDIRGTTSAGRVRIFGTSEDYEGTEPDYTVDLTSELGNISVTDNY